MATDHRALRRRPARILPPKEGANNFALALIDFASLAEYERYRERLQADPDALQNISDMLRSGCVLVESRSFLRYAAAET